MASLARSAFDMAHVKNVSAYALLLKGKSAGKIVASWGSGRRVTATCCFYAGNLKSLGCVTGSFRGRGFGSGNEILSCAIFDALTRGEPSFAREFLSIADVRVWLKTKGYELVEIIA